MPFILHLLDRHAVQQEFREQGIDPAYWRRRAEYVCQAYAEEYGAALNDIQALPTPDPRGLAPDKAAPSPAALRRRLQYPHRRSHNETGMEPGNER